MLRSNVTVSEDVFGHYYKELNMSRLSVCSLKYVLCHFFEWQMFIK